MVAAVPACHPTCSYRRRAAWRRACGRCCRSRAHRWFHRISRHEGYCSLLLPRDDDVVEVGAELARCQASDFAPGGNPSARTFHRRVLAPAALVVIDQQRERLDAGERDGGVAVLVEDAAEVRHVVGTAGRPCWLQQRAAMRDVEGG